MSTLGWALSLGTALTFALRRWPAAGFLAGMVLATAIHAQPEHWLHRGMVVPAALGAWAVSHKWPRWPWVIAAVGVTVGLLSGQSWPPLERGAWMLGMCALLVGSIETARRTPRPGAWGVLVVAGGSGAVLTALTGSVRLAEEAGMALLPLLALGGTTLDDRAVSAAALVLAWTWMQAALWSYIGGWVLVPFLVLAMLWVPLDRFGDRARLVRFVLAATVAALGCAPVVVDWVRAPPF